MPFDSGGAPSGELIAYSHDIEPTRKFFDKSILAATPLGDFRRVAPRTAESCGYGSGFASERMPRVRMDQSHRVSGATDLRGEYPLQVFTAKVDGPLHQWEPGKLRLPVRVRAHWPPRSE